MRIRSLLGMPIGEIASVVGGAAEFGAATLHLRGRSKNRAITRTSFRRTTASRLIDGVSGS